MADFEKVNQASTKRESSVGLELARDWQALRTYDNDKSTVACAGLSRDLQLGQSEAKVSLGKLDQAIDKVPMADLADKTKLEDKVLADFMLEINSSRQLGASAGEYMNYLATRGMLPPDKQYGKGPNTKILLNVIKNEITGNAAKREETLANSPWKKRINEFLHQEPVLEQERNKFWKPKKFQLKEGIKVPEACKSFYQGDGVVDRKNGQLLYENISAWTDKEDETYHYGRLAILDQASGKILDLNQLLPADYRFSPSNLDGLEEKLAMGRKFKDIASALEDYKGTNKIEGGKFVCRPDDNPETGNARGEVTYGNLAHKGNMLSLLHEIGHTWQVQYHSGNQQTEYLKYYKELEAKIKAEAFKDLAERKRTNGDLLSKKELTIDSEDGREDAGTFKLTKSYDVKISENNQAKVDYEITVNSAELKLKVENYVRQEREAWAHALRTLRFLRLQGFDLEPEMQDIAEIHTYMHRALKTYQKSLEKDLIPGEGVKNFTIKA